MARHNYVVAPRADSFAEERRLVPAASGRVVRQPGGNGTAGFEWLKAAAEMAGMTSSDWSLSADSGGLGKACFPLAISQTLAMDGEAVRAGREFSIAALRRWGVTQRCEDITTVVSELLTNALRHAIPALNQNRASWPVRVGLLQSGPHVLCVVADPSSSPPAPKRPSLIAESGRGLHVVGSLSDKWGYTTYITPSDTGKVVWAIFLIPPGPPKPG